MYNDVAPRFGSCVLPQVSFICIVRDIYRFIKCTMIPDVDSEINLHANIFGISDGSDALHDNQLKNNHPLVIPLLI